MQHLILVTSLKIEELINTNPSDLADKKRVDLEELLQTIILSLPKDVRALLLSFSIVGNDRLHSLFT